MFDIFGKQIMKYCTVRGLKIKMRLSMKSKTWKSCIQNSSTGISICQYVFTTQQWFHLLDLYWARCLALYVYCIQIFWIKKNWICCGYVVGAGAKLNFWNFSFYLLWFYIQSHLKWLSSFPENWNILWLINV